MTHDTFVRRTAFCCALLLTGALWLRAGILYIDRSGASHPSTADPASSVRSILIDPGHGGEDGGAQGADGTLEKEINLAISLSLRDLLQLFGFSVSMTRDTDVSIYDPAYAQTSGKKASDMRNRLALYNQAEYVISIHQNHFSQTQYSGTQIFYSPNHPSSQALAQTIRTAVLTLLQPDNKRELKQADEQIYLLHESTIPAVLVECGFLSNEAERDQLKTDVYQKKMAFSIARGLLEYEM